MRFYLLLTLLFLTGCNRYSDYEDRIEELLKTQQPTLSKQALDCSRRELIKYADRFCWDPLLNRKNVTERFNSCFTASNLDKAAYELKISLCDLQSLIEDIQKQTETLKSIK